MREIIENGLILARHIVPEDIKEGLNFFSNDEEFLQVGVWDYQEGKNLLAHIHNEAIRAVQRTYETLYVISGSLEAKIYDESENEIETIIINAGDILVLLEGGHGYKVLKDNTRVLEIKNGPYLGADADRRRIGEQI